MQPQETIHRYPRLLTWTLELIASVLVLITLAIFTVTFLRGFWAVFPPDRATLDLLPFLRSLIALLNDGETRPRPSGSLAMILSLLGPLLWLGITLFAALMMRNALPVVRASDRGLLVSFAGDWLPIAWEDVTALRSTSDVAATRFVLLVQTRNNRLTTWHRFYSFLYGFSWQRGFLITSSIADFQALIQTAMSEAERAARFADGKRSLTLDEGNPSLIFRLVLSPASFFSSSSSDEASTSTYTGGYPIKARYPARISTLLEGGANLIWILAILNYLWYWVRFLALELPFLRGLPPFSWPAESSAAYVELINAFRTRPVPFFGIADRLDLPAPWWLLISAHLMLGLAFVAVQVLRSLLPALEVRAEGIAVREGKGSWKMVPWAKITALKGTEVSEQSQVVLIETDNRTLGPLRSIANILYDGALAPGILITSAISNFPEIMRAAIDQLQPIEEQQNKTILRQDAPSFLFWMAGSPVAAAAQLAGDARQEPDTAGINQQLLMSVLPTATALAVPVAALLLIDKTLLANTPPGLGLLFGLILMLLIAILEWPVAALISTVLDENSGGGEEHYRALYLYPSTQLPRILPMLLAVILMLVGWPLLAIFAWIGAIAWSFWLSKALWVALYDWNEQEALVGGLVPVVWQMITLLIFLVAQR